MNIVTINNGFELSNNVYTWSSDTHTEIICATQIYAFTSLGIILLDLTFSINGIMYTNIIEFSNSLN